MNIQLKTILIILSVFHSVNCYSQDSIAVSINGLNKNIVYGTASLFRYMASVSANYERIIKFKENAPLKYSIIKIGYGEWADWGESGNYIIVGLSGLTGSRASHFESHLGLTVLYFISDYELELDWKEYINEPHPSKSDFIKYYPSFALGYRYQKPGGYFVFRTGSGFPEYLYVSLGISF